MLALYDFTSYTASSNSGAAATSNDPNVTASNYAPNASAFVAFSANSTAANYFFTGSGNPAPAVGTQSSTVPATDAASVTANTYFALTLTPATGYALSFNTTGGTNTLTFDLRVRNTTAGSTAVPFTENLVLRSSVDNFAAAIGTVTGTVTTANTNTGFVAETISLTSLGTLASNAAVTLRLYPNDNQNVSQDDFSVDNLVVNGIAAVPEPSTVAALGIGLAALVAARRRSGQR